MKYKLSYSVIEGKKRPVIPIKFRKDGKFFSYLALIDSGADFNIFHKGIADILGIDIAKLPNTSFGGINKEAAAKGKYTSVEIGVDGYFFEAPVVFSGEIPDFGYGILGQVGFFDHFRIKFDYKSGNIELRTGE